MSPKARCRFLGAAAIVGRTVLVVVSLLLTTAWDADGDPATVDTPVVVLNVNGPAAEQAPAAARRRAGTRRTGPRRDMHLWSVERLRRAARILATSAAEVRWRPDVSPVRGP